MRRPGAHTRTNSPGHASPTAISVDIRSSPAGSSDDSTVGVNTAALTRWSCSNAVNASPAYTSGGATTNAAPDPTASNNSPIDASNVGAATINTRASAPNSNCARCAAAQPSRPACVTATPFGAPVDPEVDRTYAVSSTPSAPS